MSEIDYDAAVEDDAKSGIDLATIAVQVHRQIALEDEVAEIEAKLKERKRALLKVSQETIPSLLEQTGLSEIRLDDGTKVIVTEEMNVSTTGKYRDAINKWLKETGSDDLIKNELTVPFGRNEDEALAALLSFLEEAKQIFRQKVYVEPQTMKAHIKSVMARGEDVPLDDLGVHTYKKTKLERPET